ncbi:MAG: hypothetical protein HYV02_08225 [Deltaproteobacteria bacterium]|nr:hypothetical protein [Deltaproteobacteria bacterium]
MTTTIAISRVPLDAAVEQRYVNQLRLDALRTGRAWRTFYHPLIPAYCDPRGNVCVPLQVSDEAIATGIFFDQINGTVSYDKSFDRYAPLLANRVSRVLVHESRKEYETVHRPFSIRSGACRMIDETCEAFQRAWNGTRLEVNGIDVVPQLIQELEIRWSAVRSLYGLALYMPMLQFDKNDAAYQSELVVIAGSELYWLGEQFAKPALTIIERLAYVLAGTYIHAIVHHGMLDKRVVAPHDGTPPLVLYDAWHDLGREIPILTHRSNDRTLGYQRYQMTEADRGTTHITMGIHGVNTATDVPSNNGTPSMASNLERVRLLGLVTLAHLATFATNPLQSADVSAWLREFADWSAPDSGFACQKVARAIGRRFPGLDAETAASCGLYPSGVLMNLHDFSVTNGRRYPFGTYPLPTPYPQPVAGMPWTRELSSDGCVN